ncbi:MAG TPA: TIGR03620 family F420-dependent LLM class oxidoreductase [Jatrophihabitantaceae bacterium]|jgi:probable F420-dependent oxidoreductase
MTNIDRDALRAQLGRIGVWSVAAGHLNADDERKAVGEIERLGYRTLWLSETLKEVFAHAGLALAASRSMVVATGIANIWMRQPQAMASGARVLADAYPGRFVLGLGVGHPGFAPGYERPLAAMREYLDEMDADRPPAVRMLAALRPKMLELAAARSGGAVPYLGPVEHTALARQELGPDPVLAPELAIVLDADAGRARQIARDYLRVYLELSNYTNNLRVLGFADADFADGGSNRLVDAIVGWGDVDAVVERVRAHQEAGADHVAIQPLSADGGVALDTLADLAPALLA